jgi:hypothetical protein
MDLATFGAVIEGYFDTARSYSQGFPTPHLDVYTRYRIMII